MTKRQIFTAVIAIIAFPLLRAVPAMALGDRVVPHVVDGDQGDGIRYRTKFDISNISPFKNTTITKATVFFYKDNGNSWVVAIKDPVTGNTLNVSSYTLNRGFSQTVRLETLGTGSLDSGYVVIRNLEVASEYPDEREIAITVIFEVLKRNAQGTYNIIDTISVPTSQPTVSWTFPVEIDTTTTLGTGYAVVNLANATNNITVDLYETKSPLSGDATQTALSAHLNLNASEKKVGFLNLAEFFQGTLPTKFKGMAVAAADSPVSFLALLQTPTPPNGVQFATLVPTYLDSLRHNTMMYLPQGFSLDADLLISDYFRDENSTEDAYYETPWDVLFRTGSTDTARLLSPQQNALIYPIGVKTVVEFDAIGLDTLQALNYTIDPIDMGDDARTSKLIQGYTFAIKTGLGRYVKARIRNWVTYSGSPQKDLMLEIFAYR